MGASVVQEVNLLLKASDEASPTMRKLAAEAKAQAGEQLQRKRVAEKEDDFAFKQFIANEREKQRVQAETARKEQMESTFAGRVKMRMQEERASGGLATERLFRGGGERLGMMGLEGLTGASLTTLVATQFALEGVANGLEKVAEHAKNVREGVEGMGESIAKSALDFLKEIPILGGIARIGDTIGKMIVGDPDEDLKEAKKFFDELTKLDDALYTANQRARIGALVGTPKELQAAKDALENKTKASLKERSGLQEKADALGPQIEDAAAAHLHGGGWNWADLVQQRNELLERIRTVNETMKLEETASAEDIARIELAAATKRASLLEGYRKEDQTRDFESRQRKLRSYGDDTQAEVEAITRTTKLKTDAIGREAMKAADNDPANARQINNDAEDAIRAARASGEKESVDVRTKGAEAKARIADKEISEYARFMQQRKEQERKSADEITDLQVQARAARMKRLGLDLEAEQLVRKSAYDKEIRKIAEETGKQLSELLSHPIAAINNPGMLGQIVAAAKAMVAARTKVFNEADDKLGADDAKAKDQKHFEETSKYARARIDLLKSEADLGDSKAARQAQELELAEKYRAIRHDILKTIEDEHTSGGDRMRGRAALLLSGQAEKNERLRLLNDRGSSLSQDFQSTADSRYLTGARGVNADSAARTATATEKIADWIDANADTLGAIAKFVSNLKQYIPNKS